MGTARIHEGVRRMRFENLLDRQERGEITQADAAEMLGVSPTSRIRPPAEDFSLGKWLMRKGSRKAKASNWAVVQT